jgi:mRNA interferase MazF
VTVALQGSHGKPRPALIVQSDTFAPSSHVAVLLLTTVERNAPLLRVPIRATSATGLNEPSFAMLDRLTTAPRDKVRAVVGHVDEATMLIIGRLLVTFLGLAQMTRRRPLRCAAV